MTALKITVLGCGGSGGVPLVCGHWGDCDPDEPKNLRKRASIAVQSDTTTLVIDTGPDFRAQTLETNIKRVDGVLYTHAHDDHIVSIGELRYASIKQKEKIPVYFDPTTLEIVQTRFAHMFAEDAAGFYPVCLDVNNLVMGQVHKIGDIEFIPFMQEHGVGGHSIGFRFGNFAYSTDVSGLSAESLGVLKGINTWVLDCGQFDSDFTVIHPNFEMVQAWNAKVGAEKVYLTHLTPRIDYKQTSAKLPAGYALAFDGLVIESAR